MFVEEGSVVVVAAVGVPHLARVVEVCAAAAHLTRRRFLVVHAFARGRQSRQVPA